MFCAVLVWQRFVYLLTLCLSISVAFRSLQCFESASSLGVNNIDQQHTYANGGNGSNPLFYIHAHAHHINLRVLECELFLFLLWFGEKLPCLLGVLVFLFVVCDSALHIIKKNTHTRTPPPSKIRVSTHRRQRNIRVCFAVCIQTNCLDCTRAHHPTPPPPHTHSHTHRSSGTIPHGVDIQLRYN